MKKILVLVVTLLVTTTLTQADPIPRIPPITTSLYSNILYWQDVAESQHLGQRLYIVEGEDINISYYSFGVTPYLVIQSPGLADGGAILKMDPVTANGAGVTGPGVYFRDVVSGSNYFMAYINRIDGTEGSFTVAGQRIFVNITYPAFPIYPHMTVTWGAGARPNNVGDVIDDFSQVIVDIPVATNSLMSIFQSKGSPDLPDGTYVGNEAPEGHYVIQSSADTVHWMDTTNTTAGILGYTYYYQFPLTSENKFFRAKRIP